MATPLATPLEPAEPPERILVVTAHPDDVDFGAAGSVAAWTDAGIDVHYCVVTDGDAGEMPPEVARTEAASVRRAEQHRAAKVVGVTDVHWLGYLDGRVEATLELRRDISRVIRLVRPQRVVCQSPERNVQRIYASHPDHLAAGEATICAVYPDARNPYAHPELLDTGFDPWTVDEVWVMAAGAASDTYVDVAATLDRKVEALACHESQIRDPEAIGAMIREWAQHTAAQFELPEGSAVEAFRRIETR